VLPEWPCLHFSPLFLAAHLLLQPKDARTSGTGIDIVENIWCISLLTALVFSGLGAILWKFILNIRPGNLFLYWITTTCASTAINVILTFPLSEQGFLYAALAPLIMFGSKTFRSEHEDEAIVLWIAALVCIVICVIFPWIMSILIKKATLDYGLVYWQVVFVLAITGMIYAYGAIYYMRLARKLMDT